MSTPDFVAAEELRLAINRIKRDLDYGWCSPDRLEANLTVCDAAIDRLFGEEEPEQLELHDLILGGHAARPVRPGFTVIDGGRS